MDVEVYRLTRFFLLLFCLIPSIICFLLVFIFLFKTQQITYKHLHNHVILVLLVCNFILVATELPITLLYSYRGQVVPQSDQFCSFWVAYNYGLYVAGLFLMAFGSIERYFLIFHHRSFHRWRHIVHYPLILFCFFYPLTFYSVTIGTYPCENAYYYDAYVCGGACYQFYIVIGSVDYVINAVTPTVLIAVSNMILLFRVVKQKRAMKIVNTWRRNRLMYIQLVSISVLYFLIWIPFVIISLLRLFYDPFFLQDVTLMLLNYCLYICPLASPFISLVGLPVVRQHLKQSIRCIICFAENTTNRIRPTVSAITPGGQQHIMRRQQHGEHAF